MRGATECAKRLKTFYAGLRSKLGKVRPPAPTDPITELILGILSRDVPESRAADGLERLRAIVVDYNELRVIPPIELADVLHDFADARLKCEDLSRALNTIFALEHIVSLDRVATLPRKEMLAYLERIDGLEPYTRARIRLLGFQQPAVPLDEAMWALVRTAEIVDARCPLEEAQQFLERQTAAEELLEFVGLLRRQAWSEHGALVKSGVVQRIQSVPPDRTTRNMLLMLTGAPSVLDVALSDEDDLLPSTPIEDATEGEDPKPPGRPKGARRARQEVTPAESAPGAPRPRKSARQPTPAEGKPTVKAKRTPREPARKPAGTQRAPATSTAVPKAPARKGARKSAPARTASKSTPRKGRGRSTAKARGS
ncbi:MAG: hypothetical protein IPM18_09715 [Phycisphaerales bacterium]|nr:hypothetical protein [Phycisphaerales bacterium]